MLTFTFLCLSGDVIPSSGSSGRVGRVDDGLQVGGDDDGDVDDEYHLDGGGVGESGRAKAGKKVARFPDPLLEVGRGYSVSIPW